MTLHLLIVEDDDAFIEELSIIIEDLPGNKKIRVAGSRDDAFAMLEDTFLDLVILDLTIPTISGALDADPEHGRSVFNRIQTVTPGTPVFILTGSPAEEFLSDHVLRNHQQIDIWGEGRKTSTVLFLKKYNIDKCPDELKPVASAVEGLSDVELERKGVELGLAEDRLIRIFTKKFNGVRCVVSILGGGHSGAQVYRIRITDSHGVQVHDAVAKLSTPSDVQREGERYDKYVVRLDPAATPRKLATLEFGAHTMAGIFFGLADGFTKTMFDVAGDSSGEPVDAIDRIKVATAPWNDGVPQRRMRIKVLRQRVLSDEALDVIRHTFKLDWIEDFEDREIQVHWACSHGDLHGRNILVSNERVTLIDYGDVGDGPASLDPVTLELSLLFHPDAPYKTGIWPSTEHISMG